MSRAFAVLCLALLSGAAAYVVALAWLPSTLFDGHYVPVGMDSFYHARRILDTVASPGSFYEFDPRIHAPEGSWITWPWAYDLSLAWVVIGLQRVTGAADPMAILVYIPPTWAFVNAGLLLATGAALGLRLRWLALLGGLFAFSPLTQMLHGVGVIDHHYLEYSFVLATVLLGWRWLETPASRGRAALLGALLGVAPAFHNGMFALQIPVDLTLFLLWWRGQLPAGRSVSAFAVALLAATLAAVLPSEPFRAGQFSFATLSWFHLYVAALSAAGTLYLAGRPRSPLDLAVLGALGAAALAPIASDAVTGSHFVAATLVKLGGMGEALGLREQIAFGGAAAVSGTYSPLIALLPLIAIAAAVAALRGTTPPRWRFAAVFALFGTGLLCFQARLHYYGSAALFLAPLLGLQAVAARLPPRRGLAASALGAAALVAAYLPHFRDLWVPVPVAWDFGDTYRLFSRHLYPQLRQACAEHPGIVLADHNDGHYIRYHTECSVLSNNFILTPQHEQKLLETDHLMGLGAREIVERRPDIDYIFVRRRDDLREGTDPEAVAAMNTGLRAELLLGEAPYPPGLQLVRELKLQRGPSEELTVARIFRIRRPDPAVAAPGAAPGSPGP